MENNGADYLPQLDPEKINRQDGQLGTDCATGGFCVSSIQTFRNGIA